MQRREFIALLGGAAAAWPLSARAQQSSNKIPVVGVLWHASNAEEEEVYQSVVLKAFNDLGYVEGKNIHLLNSLESSTDQGGGKRRGDVTLRSVRRR